MSMHDLLVFDHFSISQAKITIVEIVGISTFPQANPSRPLHLCCTAKVGYESALSIWISKRDPPNNNLMACVDL